MYACFVFLLDRLPDGRCLAIAAASASLGLLLCACCVTRTLAGAHSILARTEAACTRQGVDGWEGPGIKRLCMKMHTSVISQHNRATVIEFQKQLNVICSHVLLKSSSTD